MCFIQTDAGRARSPRRKLQKQDCTVRALATVSGLSYDEAYKLMKQAGRESSSRFPFRQFASTSENFRWKAFQAVKGKPRLNLLQFCKLHPTGEYVVKISKHVVAVINGVAHDDIEPRWDACVYGAWEYVRDIGQLSPA